MRLSQTLVDLEVLNNGESSSKGAAPPFCTSLERKATPFEIEQAVIALYERDAPGLMHFLTGAGTEQGLAQDAVQEGFLRYFVALMRGDEISHGKAWVYRVARNYVLDRNKEYAARHNTGLDREEFTLSSNTSDQIEAEFLRAEILTHARHLLSSKELECLQLRAEGFQYREIARILQVRSGTVGTMLGRGLDKIRRALNL